MIQRILFSVLLLSLLISCGIAGAVSALSGNDTAPADEALSERLALGDHRFLDTFTADAPSLKRLDHEQPAVVYALGRALEARGLSATADEVYRYASRERLAPWSGLAATRRAVLATRRGDHPAALAFAEEAVERFPASRDGWYHRGEALYHMEAYDTLLEYIATIPPPDELTFGDEISSSRLQGEIALWNAVSRYRERSGNTTGFVAAFTTIPAGPIHSRLYLYLFYRDRSFPGFAPEDRLLLEGVYRVAREEYSEGLRLLTMIEPQAFREYLLGAGVEPLAAGLERALVRVNPGVDRWLQDVAAAGPPALQARFGLLRARGAETSGNISAALEQLKTVAEEQSELQTQAIDRYLELRVEQQHPLTEVLEELLALGAADTVVARAVDRLLPAEVRRSNWAAVEEALSLVPPDSSAATHLGVVLAAAQEKEGYRSSHTLEQLLAPAMELSPLDYMGLAARNLAGSSVDITAELTSPEEESPAAPPADYHLQLADALLTAGLAGNALSIGMTVALDSGEDAGIAEDSRQLARRMALLGHTSAALDLMRRVAARSTAALTTGDLAILYPPAFQREIATAAGQYGVPAALLTGLVREESHFRSTAVSPVGAQGLAQLMPATAEDIIRRLGRDEVDLDSAQDNLQLGAYYINYLGEQIDPPVIRLAAYNAGLGRGRRWTEEFGTLTPLLQIEALPFIETRWYVRRISVSAAVYQWYLDETPLQEGFELVLTGGNT